MYTIHFSPDGLAFGLRSFFAIQLKYRRSDLQAAPPASEGAIMTTYTHILDLVLAGLKHSINTMPVVMVLLK
jgi:hypothetical protein